MSGARFVRSLVGTALINLASLAALAGLPVLSTVATVAAAASVAAVATVATIATRPAFAAPQAVSALDRRPDAIIDLRTDAGVASVSGAWKVIEAKLAEVDFKNPGADLKPSGTPNRTFDITPKAGAREFDDSAFADRVRRRRSGRRERCSPAGARIPAPRLPCSQPN